MENLVVIGSDFPIFNSVTLQHSDMKFQGFEGYKLLRLYALSHNGVNMLGVNMLGVNWDASPVPFSTHTNVVFLHVLYVLVSVTNLVCM
jgi:hypothetical protein